MDDSKDSNSSWVETDEYRLDEGEICRVSSPYVYNICSAMLRTAVRDIGSLDRAHVESAYKWFNEERPEVCDDYIFSFQSVCEILSLCPDKVKRNANKIRILSV